MEDKQILFYFIRSNPIRAACTGRTSGTHRCTYSAFKLHDLETLRSEADSRFPARFVFPRQARGVAFQTEQFCERPLVFENWRQLRSDTVVARGRPLIRERRLCYATRDQIKRVRASRLQYPCREYSSANADGKFSAPSPPRKHRDATV